MPNIKKFNRKILETQIADNNSLMKQFKLLITKITKKSS